MLIKTFKYKLNPNRKQKAIKEFLNRRVK